MAEVEPKPKSWLLQGFEFAASAFEFSTPYEIVFKDWRLTLLQVFFTFMVAVYVAVRSVLFWSIVSFDQVATGFNSWCYTSWTSPSDSDLAAPHCGANPVFDLAPNVVSQLGGLEAYNHTCPRVIGADVMRQVGAEAQVTLWRQLRRNTAGCEPGVPPDAVDTNGKRCYENYFTDGVEDLPLFLIHTVSASQTGIRRNNMACMIVRKIGDETLAETRVGENNNGWAFTLRQLLQYAGNVTLDDINEGNLVPVRPGTKIRLRHTGFILTMRFRYWNYQAWPEAYWDLTSFPWDWQPNEPRCAVEVELQPQAWGFIGAEPVTEGSMLSTVARIQFVGSGRFGQLSTVLIISSLVEAVVLMGIASSVTLYVARFLYGEAFREVTETSFERYGHKKEEDEDAEKGKGRLFGRSRKSAFARVDRRTGLRVSSQSYTSEAESALDRAATSDVESAAGGVPGLSPATARLLQDLAISERLRRDPTDETLLQGYLRRRISGESDTSALRSLCLQLEMAKSEQIGARLSDIAERCVSQVGADESNMAVSELLELATKWREEPQVNVNRQDTIYSKVLQQWI